MPLRGETASEFIVREGDDLFLFTCWHVVTSFHPSNPEIPFELPKRRFLKLIMQLAEKEEHVVRIGSKQEVIIPLYDKPAPPWTPCWQQEIAEKENWALNAIGIRTPSKQDAVKIKLPKDLALSDLQIIQPEHIYRIKMPLIAPGEKVFVVGYPYGFSAIGMDQPTPVVYTRFVASMPISSRIAPVLLDSIAAPGISGGAVFVSRDDGNWLFGIYTGSVFPETVTNPRMPDNNRITDLGAVCNISFVLENIEEFK